MTDILGNVQSLIRPELTLVIAFCYQLGKALKSTERISNKDIPIVLMIVGAAIGMVYVTALEPDTVALSMIIGFMQGAIAGFASTGFYESKRNTLG